MELHGYRNLWRMPGLVMLWLFCHVSNLWYIIKDNCEDWLQQEIVNGQFFYSKPIAFFKQSLWMELNFYLATKFAEMPWSFIFLFIFGQLIVWLIVASIDVKGIVSTTFELECFFYYFSTGTWFSHYCHFEYFPKITSPNWKASPAHHQYYCKEDFKLIFLNNSDKYGSKLKTIIPVWYFPTLVEENERKKEQKNMCYCLVLSWADFH